MPGAQEHFKAFIKLVRDVVAANNPGLPVFMSFAFEDFYANGLNGSLNGCSPLSLDACFDSRVEEALSLTGDAGIGLSNYPQNWYPRSEQMPVDRFRRLRAHTRQPLWVTETGWSTVPLRFSYAAPTCSDSGQQYYDAAIANEASQRAEVAQTLAIAEDAGVAGLVWWAYGDYLDATVASTCPCSPSTSDTCQRIDAFGDAAFFYRAFGTMGLVRQDGSKRPAFDEWSEFFSRTRQ